MGVAVLQLYPTQNNVTGPQAIETLAKRIVELGATQAGQFLVDCEVHQSVTTQAGQLGKNLYILHNSEFPATVFSVLECNNKTVTLTSDTLFDLLMLKLQNVYKKKTTIESKGPRFEIKDFLVKFGSVTVGGVFKGILVEVEYCPGVVPNNCWGILAEFMQGLLGNCVPSTPPAYISKKGGETYTPSDTVQQYLDHFNQFRKTAGVR
jgi:mediator of RNA polymerase II transcription subunit 20